eukprot:GHVU01005572.1.p3 GENE.GHVU01005572.1~~GHVU01005572.1.p3  ORF type:complete len:197 (-),score=25.94 GHVU01005572.1:118-708(-)
MASSLSPFEHPPSPLGSPANPSRVAWGRQRAAPALHQRPPCPQTRRRRSTSAGASMRRSSQAGRGSGEKRIRRRKRRRRRLPPPPRMISAAVLSTGGSVYSGCNVEIAVNPLGICAERVAIVKAVGAGARKMRGLAVTTPKGKGFASPCGACRQLIMEFGDYPVLRIDLDRETGNFAVKKMSTYELVPDGFHPEQL